MHHRCIKMVRLSQEYFLLLPTLISIEFIQTVSVCAQSLLDVGLLSLSKTLVLKDVVPLPCRLVLCLWVLLAIEAVFAALDGLMHDKLVIIVLIARGPSIVFVDVWILLVAGEQ